MRPRLIGPVSIAWRAPLTATGVSDPDRSCSLSTFGVRRTFRCFWETLPQRLVYDTIPRPVGQRNRMLS
jgi:hypothetical protein